MSESQTDGGKGRRFGSMAALVVGGAVAGAVLAGVVSANAATTTPSPSTSTGSSSSSSSQPGSETKPAMPDHGSTAHESAEKPVTGDAATKAKAAALAAVGGTAGEVTTDFTGTGYEVTVTKADGTTTEVHLNSSFEVQQGGRGDHGSAAEEAAEKAVTGDAAAKAKAAAVAAVGGTAGAVTTDSHGEGYEVTVTKADGTTTEVHLNSSFEVQQGGRGVHGPGDGHGPGSSSSGSSSSTASPGA